MGQSLVGAFGPGLALAGVLAVTGIAAARVGHRLPHLGIAAVGVAVAAAAGRAAALPVPAVVIVLAAGGAMLGVVAFALDARVRRVTTTGWPPALLPDIAVLAMALGVAALARPPLAVELPVGPLGGVVSTLAGGLALVVGVAGAAVLVAAPIRRDGVTVWIVAGAVSAVAVAVGSGALIWSVPGIPPLLGVADVVGLAVRAAAVGAVARVGVLPGLTAALVLGVGELALRTVPAAGELAVLPALVVLAVALASSDRVRRHAEAAG